MVRRKIESHKFSNLARVIATLKSNPSARESTSTVAFVAVLRVRFAASHALRKRRSALSLFFRLTLFFFSNS
jgi:hypothetical protein